MGTVKALFAYTCGGNRLDLGWVELLENGRVVARDEYAETTGLANKNDTYQFKLPAVTPGAKYTLRAHVRADGGNDSNGDIFVSNQLDGKVQTLKK